MKNFIMIILFPFLMDGVFGAEEMKEVTEGDSLTLPTGLTETQSSGRILWLYGSDKTIVAQIDEGTYRTNVNDERFKDNLELDKQTGSLTIKNNRIKNSGLYELDIGGGTKSKKFNVKVYASLPTPDIDPPPCAQTPAGSSSPRCVFQCSVQASDQTTLSWYSGNRVVSSRISDICSIISLRLEVNYEDKNIYSCMVNNPISNKTKHLDITQFCKPCEDSGPSIGVIIGIVVAVLLAVVLAVAAAVIYNRNRWSELGSIKPEALFCEEGKTAVLHSYHEIKKGVQMLWRLVSVKDSAIASMSENDKKTYWYDERFRGRLQLDPQTGSLIIRNLRKTDAGVYFLEIKSKGGTAYRKYKLILSGEVETVSVKEGGDVTLKFSGKSVFQTKWEFKEEKGFIATINDSKDNEPKYQDGSAGGRFRDRLELDTQTGFLTIKNIRTEHTGLYRVITDPGNNCKKLFNVVFDDFTETSGNESVITGFMGRIQRFCGLARIDGVFGDEEDEMKTMSVMEGDVLKLNTDTEIQTDDEIILRFGKAFRKRRQYVFIARFSKQGDDRRSADRRFKDRLKLDLTGPLTITITNFEITDYGDYYVQITNKKKKSFKSFTFIVVPSGDVVKSVSVMKGKLINLNTNITDLQEEDQILWTFGPHGMIIANTETFRFKDRVKLNKKTGSLIITNSKTADAGLYHLQIISINRVINQRFNVTVNATNEVMNISVKEGGSVILETDTKIQKDDQIQWKFGDQHILIAQIRGGTGQTHDGDADVRFRDRVKLDEKTGSLTITNSTAADAGLYHLQIISSNRVINQRFNVTVNVMNISVKEGESVTLKPETEIQKDDQIQWRFVDEDILIAEIRGGTRETHDDADDGRFRGRLKLDEKTGSLNITDTRTSDSGDYKLQIKSNSGVSYKAFSVVVRDIFYSSFTSLDQPEAECLFLDIHPPLPPSPKLRKAGNRVNDSATVEMPPVNEEDWDAGDEEEGMSLLVVR